MRLRLLASFFLLCFACTPAWAQAPGRATWQAAAAGSNEPVLTALMEWQSLLDPDSGATFDDIRNFMNNYPDWPLQNKLRVRAEFAMQDAALSDSDIIAFFGDSTPLTGAGKIALAEASMRSGISGSGFSKMIREGWISGDFDEAREKLIRGAHSGVLTQDDDIARTDRLLWEEKTTGAKRMLPSLPKNYRHLFEARIALIEDKKTVSGLMALVPGSLMHDAGLTYDRMRYRARRDDKLGVREMLLIAPATPPYPQKWWKHRELQVRRAIDENNISMAKKLLANHGQTEGSELADAKWLSGWLELEFLHKPHDAYSHFESMYDEVKYPVSKARAAYWAGLAAERMGNSETSRRWFSFASDYPTTFYGQLASLKVNGTAPVELPSAPSVGSEARERFEQSSMVRAIKLAIQYGGIELAGKLINLNIEATDSKDEAVLFAQLGKSMSQDYLSVRGSKKAQQQFNVTLITDGYPRPPTPEGLPIERALALAITRQESEFDPYARSPSGALGMMQLLPSTARETAKKIDMNFSASDLYQRDYNTTLGSHYLSRMIDNYSGSYVMAIAAYNAGPGNVRNWAGQFGTPGNDVESAVNWIEKIPFAETRNYVQRVLENLQVYRQLENDSSKLALAEDLVR